MNNGEYSEHSLRDQEEQEIHLRDYLHVISKRKNIVIGVLCLVFLLTVLATFTAVPYYTASSEVLIERNYGTRGLEVQYYHYEPEFIDTQSEIIRSVNVAQRVVDQLDLAEKYRSYFFGGQEEEHSFFSSIKSVITGWLSSGLSFFSSADKIDRDGLADAEAKIKAEPLSDGEIIARIISGGLSVTPVEETKIVSISYSDRDPAMAKMIANAVVRAYMDEMLEIKLASSSYALQWMTQKAEQERDKLERSERALQKYMRDNDLVTVENNLAIYPQKLNEFSSQLSKAEAERKELGALLAQIEAAGDNFDKLENIPVFAESKVLESVRERYYKANQNISELSKKYGPKHPTMVKAKEELGVLRNERRFEIQRIVAATKNAYDLADSRENNLKELLEQTKNELLNLNEKYIQYSILKRDVDSNRVLYDALQSSIKTESVTEQSQSVNIWVVRKADLPEVPSSPRKRRNILLGIVLGLFGGISLAFLVEYLDNTIKSEVELEKRYGISVLGTVEKIKSTGKNNIESYILQEPLSPVAESYRLIRSGLLLSSAEKPPATILVTSMGPGEGKTSTAVNLARVLAQTGQKVLVVDCDLRKPRVHSMLGMDNKHGLSNYLAGVPGDTEIIRSVPNEALSIIPSGPIPPNPAELLGSRKMEELLQELKHTFDFILLDSPPVQSVTDGLVLSRIAEGTILIIRSGKTTFDTLNAGLKKLLDVNAHVLGFVLNGLRKGDARGYYSYGYSSYYASEDGQKRARDKG